ncbi:hypothetical protein [Hamadaea tsunoensis]|uniref:hypothetical protein n=1 Tax=Hamadaea tsunoensis TaxID=53368 RepID=UPI00041CF6B9|nr:hypothetical protein [Hamadaea tsunoensis]
MADTDLMRVSDWVADRYAPVGRWLERTEERLDRTAAGSVREWVRPMAATVAAAVLLVVVLHLMVAALFTGGPVARAAGAGLFAVVALGLQVVVIRNVLISIAEPSRRRYLLIASLAAVSALLTSVGAFAAATAAVRSQPLWPAERGFLWQLADAVPLLGIPGRVGWTEPPLPNGFGWRLTLLAFKIIVIVPLLRLVVALYELAEAQRGEPRSRTRTWRLGALQIEDAGVLSSSAVAAGFLWGAFGPGTPLWRQAVPIGPAGPLSLVVLMVFGALATRAYWGAFLGTLEVFAIFLLGPPRLAAVLAALFVFPSHSLGTRWLPFLAGGGFGVRLAVFGLAWSALYTVLGRVWIVPGLATTAIAAGLLLLFAGGTAPGRLWLLDHVRGTPGGFALGPGFATAAVWYALAYVAGLVGRMPVLAGQAGGPGTRYERGWLVRRLLDYACAGTQILIAAAGALVAVQGPGPAGLYAPAAVAAPVDAWRCFESAVWNTADIIPGPDIPAVLGWRAPAGVPGPVAGTVVLLALVVVVLLAVFPIARSVFGWARWKAGSVAESPGLATPELLIGRLRAVQEFVAATPEPARRGVRLPESTRLAETRHELRQAEETLTRLQDVWGVDTPMHRYAWWAYEWTRRAYWATIHGSRTRFELPKAEEALTELDFYALRWRTALRAVSEEGDPVAVSPSRPPGQRPPGDAVEPVS